MPSTPRSKTISLEKLRFRLLHEVDSVESEDKCLGEFRREMELLQQEKMAHVEELRQIHADINAVSTHLLLMPERPHLRMILSP